MLLACFMAMSMPVVAQNAADKIVGTYRVQRNNSNSKVKVFKAADGTYNAQVYWVEDLKDKNGKVRTDVKNPDKSKRNVPVNEIVLVNGLSYKDGKWMGGKIYDPTSGKSYKVTISFKDDKTLKLRGYIGVEALGETMYWYKIQ